MARVLITVHLGRHFRIFGHYDYKVLLDLGHEVHIAANFNDEIDNFEDPRVVKHQIGFVRNPFSPGNIKAYRQLKELLSSIHFDLIHRQSPSGGAITRLAARKSRKNGAKVMYTAHGFHFYKGAPKKNWLIYYNIERLLGHITDCIITINDEDYNLAHKMFPGKDIRYIHGVGIDLDKFRPQDAETKEKNREKYNYSKDDFILIYVGELSYRKHQDLLIYAINILKDKIQNVKLLLVGQDKLMEEYKTLVNKLGLQEYVEFLGYRKDVANLLMMADVAVSSSRQEGLPLNILEAMATGLPVVATDCRGNRDLVANEENGYIIPLNDYESFAEAIIKIYQSNDLRERFCNKSTELVKKYSLNNVRSEMEEIYSNYL
jgi:glycosyltransferase EpsD